MDRVLEDALRPIIDGYAKHQKNGRLLAPVPQDQKDLCVRIITARMKVLDQDARTTGSVRFSEELSAMAGLFPISTP